jgi:glyoxylase-like metal-dependent hydrolase (beta-lactamase superfamily II)
MSDAVRADGPEFTSRTRVPGNLDVRWIHGSLSRREPTDPPLQVHRYTEDTIIIRQSKDATFEAPFVFLLLGAERALLLDTGAVKDDTLRRTVDRLVDDWLSDRPRPDYRLVVAHTHSHGDHVAGDETFTDRAATDIVGKAPEDVQAFFGFMSWPDEVVEFDLGKRVLAITGIPGHHAASIAIHDARTGLLFTGDSVYPGRIYVSDFPAFVASMKRLVDFAEERRVTHVLGCHIEMTRKPRRDYYFGCRYQPSEPPLQMTVAQLRAMRDAAASVADRPGVHRFDDFIIYNGMGARTQLPLVARALVCRAREALTSRR